VGLQNEGGETSENVARITFTAFLSLTSVFRPVIPFIHNTSFMQFAPALLVLRRQALNQLQNKRGFGSTSIKHDFHFDTHHFVQRLEREGLNRAQAEGIMKAMAEVIDESVRNMTGNMVTKAQQEKVYLCSCLHSTPLTLHPASIHSASRCRTAQVRTTTP
jgi:hypothetical protein